MSSTNQAGTNQVSAGSTDTPTYSVCWDWAWMSDLPDAAFRIYCAVRAFVIEGRADQPVEVTDEYLMHQTRRSLSAVKRARNICYEYGALVEVSRTSVSVPPDAPGKKPTVRTVRTLQVQVQPPKDYAGPVNCFAERDRFLVKQATKRAREKQPEPVDNSCDGSDLHRHTDQGKRKQRSVSAGHSDGSDLTEARSNLNGCGSNLNDITTLDQGQPGSEVRSEVSREVTPSAAYVEEVQTARGDTGTNGWPDAPQEENHKTDPRDVPSSLAPVDSELDSVAARLLREAGVRGLAVAQWEPTVAAGVEDFGMSHVRQQLTGRMGGVNNPAAVVVTHRLPQLAEQVQRYEQIEVTRVHAGPVCGQCEARDGDAISARTVTNDAGLPVKCPRCHPYAVPVAA